MPLIEETPPAAGGMVRRAPRGLSRWLLLLIYRRLFATYGPQGWWPGDDDPFEVIVGAILTQAAAWGNVEKALANLRRAGVLSAEALLALSEDALAALVRPAGYFRVKARKLQAFARMLSAEFAGDLNRLFALPLPALRAKLLATYGIGPETADDIILYAARKPVFVIDAYTVRLFTRLGLTPQQAVAVAPPRTAHECGLVMADCLGGDQRQDRRSGDHSLPPSRGSHSYDAWQRLFMDHLPADVALFNEYHALIVRHGVVRCRKRNPHCEGCPLLDLCPTGQTGSPLFPAPGSSSREGCKGAPLALG